MAGILSTATVQGSGPMAKAMAIAGLVVGALLALTFIADIGLQVPFGGRSLMMDAGFIICGVMLAYLGWNALRDVR